MVKKEYIKLKIIVPTSQSKKADLLPLVKRMPVVTNFKPKQIEVWAVPTKIKDCALLHVFIT